MGEVGVAVGGIGVGLGVGVVGRVGVVVGVFVAATSCFTVPQALIE